MKQDNICAGRLYVCWFNSIMGSLEHFHNLQNTQKSRKYADH